MAQINKIGYVYSISCKESGKKYVGLHQGDSFDQTYFGSPQSLTEGSLRRRYQELWPSRNKLGYYRPNKEDFEQFFVIELLEWAESIEELFALESFWIEKLDTYKNGFNRNMGSGAKSAFGPSYRRFCYECDKETAWKSGDCYNCQNKARFTSEYCDFHKRETSHISSKCVSCYFNKITTLNWCDECQSEKKHRGGTCQSCTLKLLSTKGNCPVHGTTRFLGDSCQKCSLRATFSIALCEQCSIKTTHRNGNCVACVSKSSFSILFCTTHGKTKHKGGTCCQCTALSAQSQRFCPLCKKDTAHRGSKCMSCASKSTFSVADCPFCRRKTSHKKDSCLTCNNQAIHVRWHQSKKSEKCQICLKEATK